MPGPLDSVEIRSLVWRMFRDSADTDYINARALLFANQGYNFYWSAAQAIEKYLKCALLLNGVPVKNYGHGVGNLLTKAIEISHDLLPIILIPPPEMEIRPNRNTLMGLSYAEPFTDFVERISLQGDPGNRYRHYSSIFRKSDLHKLDECCFQLRRICFPLDIDYGGFGEKYSALCRRDPNFMPHLPLKSVEPRKSDGAWIEAAERFNFSFYAEKAKEGGKYLCGGGGMVNSALSMAVGANDIETLRWAVENLYLSRSDKVQLEDSISRIESGTSIKA